MSLNQTSMFYVAVLFFYTGSKVYYIMEQNDRKNDENNLKGSLCY